MDRQNTMAGLNDTLTLGLILVLLFGAASLYLYTRVQQCEQKLNLVESILLDIKMSAELQGYPEPPKQAEPQHQQQPPVRSPTPTKGASAFTPLEEQELYKDAIEEALGEVEPAGDLEAEELPLEDVPPAKVNTNYEAMTLAELKGLAKQKGLTGVSAMKRSQLLDALKPKSAPADGGVLSALAEQGSPVESS